MRVDDLRTDKHWTFEHINFSVNKPGNGISVNLSSEDAQRPWKLGASIRQSGFQRKLVRLDLTRVNTKDLFLATRIGEAVASYAGEVRSRGEAAAVVGFSCT